MGCCSEPVDIVDLRAIADTYTAASLRPGVRPCTMGLSVVRGAPGVQSPVWKCGGGWAGRVKAVDPIAILMLRRSRDGSLVSLDVRHANSTDLRSSTQHIQQGRFWHGRWVVLRRSTNAAARPLWSGAVPCKSMAAGLCAGRWKCRVPNIACHSSHWPASAPNAPLAGRLGRW